MSCANSHPPILLRCQRHHRAQICLVGKYPPLKLRPNYWDTRSPPMLPDNYRAFSHCAYWHICSHLLGHHPSGTECAWRLRPSHRGQHIPTQPRTAADKVPPLIQQFAGSKRPHSFGHHPRKPMTLATACFGWMSAIPCNVCHLQVACRYCRRSIATGLFRAPRLQLSGSQWWFLAIPNHWRNHLRPPSCRSQPV